MVFQRLSVSKESHRHWKWIPPVEKRNHELSPSDMRPGKPSSLTTLINEWHSHQRIMTDIYNIFIHENRIISFALTFHFVGWKMWELYRAHIIWSQHFIKLDNLYPKNCDNNRRKIITVCRPLEVNCSMQMRLEKCLCGEIKSKLKS